jgi:type II secretion system protein C
LLSNLTIRRTFWLVDVALVLCIAFLAAQIVVARTAPPPLPSVGSTPSPDDYAPDTQSAAVNKRPLSYYAPMSQRRIFGGAGAAKAARKAPKPSLDELKPTALDLRLLGTAVGGTKGMNAAVIENAASRTPKVYREGDKVASKTVVHEIQTKRVILITDGKRELLTLAETSAKARPDQPRPARPGRTNRLPRSGAGRKRPNGTTVVQRKEWEDKNVSELLGDSTITPVYKKGKVEGLQVTNIAKNEYAKSVGLQEGDVVMRVNGVKIRSLDEAYDLANKLQQAPTLRVEIMRNDRPTTLTFRVR